MNRRAGMRIMAGAALAAFPLHLAAERVSKRRTLETGVIGSYSCSDEDVRVQDASIFEIGDIVRVVHRDVKHPYIGELLLVNGIRYRPYQAIKVRRGFGACMSVFNGDYKLVVVGAAGPAINL